LFLVTKFLHFNFSGVTNVLIFDKTISIDPASSTCILGRAIVVHEVRLARTLLT
jgi:hypothetical protein